MKFRIRKHRNKLFITLGEGEDPWQKETHHKKERDSVVRFLKKRGFDVRVNKYYLDNYGASFSKNYRIGFKKDVACLLESTQRGLTIEFGNIQNLWKDIVQSFWSIKSDSRYTHLTYLEEIAVNLEIYKLQQFCFRKWDLTEVKDVPFSEPTAYILNKERSNTHIHGGAKTLEEIKDSITEDSYNWKRNSNDANEKKIICGQKKYFYDRTTRRLMCGIVWHNINNMWWVITGTDTDLYNIADFNLFDYEEGMSRRKPTTSGEISNLLKKFESNRDYKTCEAIVNQYPFMKQAS
jgi:hypothetical protein